jgi:hypothetical protein
MCRLDRLLTRLKFFITHATDSDTNAARNHIIADLTKTRVIADVTSYQARQSLGRVDHYVADGNVAAATLIAEA